jgi:hypothetical protein
MLMRSGFVLINRLQADQVGLIGSGGSSADPPREIRLHGLKGRRAAAAIIGAACGSPRSVSSM